MNRILKVGIQFVVVLGMVWVAGGQCMGVQQPPRIPGKFKPVIGAGAQYEIRSKRDKRTIWSYAIVGKEKPAAGAVGYWLEVRPVGGKNAGLIIKQLIAASGNSTTIRRLIVQLPGRPPVEIPAAMAFLLKRDRLSFAKEDLGNEPKFAMLLGEQLVGLGIVLGSEIVRVPAGAFVCDHYRTAIQGRTADLWISKGISPYGLVKLASRDLNIVLLKTLANQTSHLAGAPYKLRIETPGP